MIKAAIFDCDGTVYDCRGASDIGDILALKRAFRELNIRAPLPTLNEVRGMMGYHYVDYYNSLIPEQFREKAFPLIFKYAKEEVAALVLEKKGKLYKGSMETLKQLKKKGINLAFITNADRTYLEAVSKAYGLDRMFSFMMSAEEANGGKLELVKLAIKNFDVKPNEAIVIGDRASDLDAARKAGCISVAALYGFGKEEELANADFKIRKIEELIKLIQNERN